MNISELKYAQILAENRELGKRLSGKEYRIAVLSNITTEQLNEVLEYTLRVSGVRATVASAGYDQIVPESEKHSGSDLCIIAWELANVVEGFQYKAAVMDAAEYEAVIERVQREIQTIFERLRSTPLVIFNMFSALAFAHADLRPGAFEQAARRLNRFLDAAAPPNVVLLDVDKIIAGLSIGKSIDFRYYYSSKALYTIDFWKMYAERVAASVRSVMGKAKKALIFDCDNTLWGGIVGEDGIGGIALTPDTAAGACYTEVQHVAGQLAAQGVILGLCTKNNPQDVDEVLSEHAGMILKDDLVIRMVNWEDKVSNLREIAKTLNIGLESLVFVDDSDFELGMVREQLPEVTVLRVPDRIHEYPSLVRQAASLFHTVTQSREDGERIRMYKEQAERAQEQKAFGSVEDYLRSLALEIDVYVNAPEWIARSAQLTQKTNQFNVTTERYTENDIRQLMASSEADVIGFGVRDRYGSYGLTAVTILRVDTGSATASIDTFLMSCRVLGRKVEFSCTDVIVAQLRKRGVTSLEAWYRRTPKNAQVEDLYDRLGFELVEGAGNDKRYRLDLATYRPFAIDYIKVAYHGRTN